MPDADADEPRGGVCGELRLATNALLALDRAVQRADGGSTVRLALGLSAAGRRR